MEKNHFLFLLQLTAVLLPNVKAQSSAFVQQVVNNGMERVTVCVALLTDPLKIVDSEVGISMQTMITVFEKALEANQHTFVGSSMDDSLIENRQPRNREVNIKPLFLQPGDSAKIIRDLQNSPYPVLALLEMSTCSSVNCDQLALLARNLPEVTIFSPCCYHLSIADQNNQRLVSTSQATTTLSYSPSDVGQRFQADNFIYMGVDPYDVSEVIWALKHTFGWRRFHFIISPNWNVYDKFYAKLAKLVADNDSSIVLTQSYYCSAYLAKGEICEANQGRSVVLKQTTVLMMMLDKSSDLPDFLSQLQALGKEKSLVRGKAYFLINHSGMTFSKGDSDLLKKAPEGLMEIRRYPHPFTFGWLGNDTKLAEMLGNWDFYHFTWQRLRVIFKAIEAFEQQPDLFGSLPSLFCNTKYNYDDSYMPYVYPVPCKSDAESIELLNLQIRNGTPALTVMGTFVEENVSASITGNLIWPGSGLVPPQEDFCLLDGTNCPPPPPKYPAIIAPTVIGFFVLVGCSAAISACIIASAKKRRKQRDLLFAEIVAEFSEVEVCESASGSLSDSLELRSISAASSVESGQRSWSKNSSSNQSSDEADEKKVPATGAIEVIGYYIPQKVKFRGDWAYGTWLRKASSNVDQETLQELIEVRNLRNANLNPFLAVTSTPNNIYYIQAYGSKGTLATILTKKKVQLDRLFKLSFAHDIANGLNYLHQSPVGSHGRLTSKSVYIDSRWFCRIGDIPLPKFEASGVSNVSIDITDLSGMQRPVGIHGSVKDKKQLKDNNGSPQNKGNLLWTAPELLRMENVPARGTKKGDVYSYGIILQEIILRSKPFGMYELSEEKMLEKITVRTFPPFRPRLPPDDEEMSDFVDLAKLCWEEIPEFRPGVATIYEMLRRMNESKETNLIDQMLRMMQNHTDRLEDLVGERTAALNDEKKKSEELLTKMLPRFVVEELKAGRIVEPESYESATIYFSDIVGFNALATESSALEIVDLLNDLYSQFDNVIDSYDVYKVETIGDAYMVCSGLPKRNGNTHAGEIATMALDMMSSVTTFKIRHRPEKTLQLRCGIHTGPVVAGVVGTKMPRYCLFGDTVNYAARMESSCLALRIHTSPECKTVLDQLGGYHLTERGFVSMKGKGEIKTYYLVGKDGFNKVLPSLELAAPISEHEFK